MIELQDFFCQRETHGENSATATLPGLFGKTVKPFLLWTNSEVQIVLSLVTDNTRWELDQNFKSTEEQQDSRQVWPLLVTLSIDALRCLNSILHFPSDFTTDATRGNALTPPTVSL